MSEGISRNGCADTVDEEDTFERVTRGRQNRNPYISTMKEDRLYHIGLVSGPQDMNEMFGDVKVNTHTYTHKHF